MASSIAPPAYIKPEPTEADLPQLDDPFEPFRVPAGTRLLQLFDSRRCAALTPSMLREIFEDARPCFETFRAHYSNSSDEAENFVRSVFFIAKQYVRKYVFEGSEVIWLNELRNRAAEARLAAEKIPLWAESECFPLPPLDFKDFSGYDSDIQEADEEDFYGPGGKAAAVAARAAAEKPAPPEAAVMAGDSPALPSRAPVATFTFPPPPAEDFVMGEIAATARSPSPPSRDLAGVPPASALFSAAAHDSESESDSVPRLFDFVKIPRRVTHSRPWSRASLSAPSKRSQPDSGFESTSGRHKAVASPAAASSSKPSAARTKTPYSLREELKRVERNPGPLAPKQVSYSAGPSSPRKPVKHAAAPFATTVHALERVSDALVSEAVLDPNGRDATFYCLPCILARAGCKRSRSGSACERCSHGHHRCVHAGADADILDTLERLVPMEQLGPRTIIGPLNAVLRLRRAVEVHYDLLRSAVRDYDAGVQNLAFFFLQMQEVVTPERMHARFQSPHSYLLVSQFVQRHESDFAAARATFLAHNPSPTPYFDSAAESDYLRPLAAKPKASRKGKEKVEDPPLPQEPSYYERPPSDVGGMEPLLAERLFNAPPLLQVASEAPRTQPRLVLRDPVQNPVGSYQNPMYSDPARSSTLLTMEPAGASPSSARDDPEDLDTAMARPSSPLTLSQIAREDAIAVGQGSGAPAVAVPSSPPTPRPMKFGPPSRILSRPVKRALPEWQEASPQVAGSPAEGSAS
ncbi:hypothetical protein C8R47DRAFT_1084815 [Mycena vitilis]|nr:hypothetical protein C8R47DRAFT_1084815 [Mycena vitilis]